METSNHSRRARQYASDLAAELDRDHTNFRDALAEYGARHAIEVVLGLSVTLAEETAGDCSVAGSSIPSTGEITVVRTSRGRMQFTALHELGHVRGYASLPFQIAMGEAQHLSRRDVEEDVCEAFAASLLLPEGTVDDVLADSGVTARGLLNLIERSAASQEACAVAVAHRMVAPGYVAIIDSDGDLRFAARSGDVLPLARSSHQQRGVYREISAGRQRFTGRGSLVYGSGTLAPEMFVDVRTRGDLAYVIATQDSPGWGVISTGTAVARATKAWCEPCGENFYGGRRCPTCDELVHAECGGCACGVSVRTPDRDCDRCFQRLPITLFEQGSNTCSECLG